MAAGDFVLFLMDFSEGLSASFGSPSDSKRAAWFLTATGIVMVGAPVIAAFIAWAIRRRTATWFFIHQRRV